eukprot:CAMPEP_0119270466 /NCGR_PEP_ID=MMETSP1329-20130426/7456_1 /TAXON_ID=114041 /ORGANISM="Genus nov. species nov., Strain RCC1024" /LENGTH=63 /DNA_ID=CAMNT_0007270489 /DNA_START=35 /DNA_END=227 /DNA_ORIENTATION=+
MTCAPSTYASIPTAGAAVGSVSRDGSAARDGVSVPAQSRRAGLAGATRRAPSRLAPSGATSDR